MDKYIEKMNLSKKGYFEILVVLVIFFLSLVLLTPGDFGENFGGETWKPWKASKLLLETGQFITHSLGPLYYTFLTLLSPFNYENSIILEYFITHIFCLYAFYRLLNLKNLKFLALLFPIAWIPFMAFIQSPKYIFAIGFLCLHFSTMNNKKIFDRWLPPYLLCAILSNWGYVLFLGGHIFGKIIQSLKERKMNFKLDKSYSTIISFILIFLFALTFINKLEKPYNNHFVVIYNHAPIPIESSPFVIGFFQIGNDIYAKREMQESEWIEADWYFTNKYAFNDCENLFCVIKNSKKTIFLNLKTTLGEGARSLTNLFFSPSIYNLNKNYALFFFILSILIASFGLMGMLYEHKWKTNLPLFCSIIIGSLGYIVALAFTKISFRYSITLIPITTLFISYSSLGIYSLINRFKFFKEKITSSRINSSIILFLLIIFLLVSHYKFHRENQNNYQFLNISKNEKLTAEANKVNFFKSYEQIFDKLSSDQRILSSEATWLCAFADVDPDKVFSIFQLPPFVPNDNTVNSFLNSLDVILISNNLTKAVSSQATQSHLRYRLHLKNYLEVNQDTWQKNEIPHYGEIYIKI